jgi:hypothetical protein
MIKSKNEEALPPDNSLCRRPSIRLWPLKPAEPTSVELPQARPRRVWLMMLATVALLGCVVTGWILLRHYRAKSALAKYEQQLLARGEKLTYAELLSPLPPGENKAFELVGACGSFRTGAVLTLNAPPALKTIAPGKALVITKQTEWVVTPGQGSFRWEQLAEDLKLNSKAREDLRAIVRSPVLRYPLNYRGLNTLLPHLGRVKPGAQHLSASALDNIRNGRIEAAVDDIEAIMLLSRLTADEPILISQLVHIAIVSIALQDCWALLQADALPDDQLARLQKVLDVDLTAGMVESLRGERVMARDAIHMLRSEELNFVDVVKSFSSGFDDGESMGLIENLPYNDEIRGAIRVGVILPMWRFIWSYEDARHSLEEIQAVLQAVEQSRAQRSAGPLKAARDTIEEKKREDAAYKSWSYFVTRLLIGAPAHGPMRAFRCQTHVEMTRAAIGLKRYQLRHRKYPQTLEQLVPEFLAKHPVDWMSGQKLLYRMEGDSFVLWSVGDNGVDDKATPDQSEPYNLLEGPDIVWPQPASEAEVEAHKAEGQSRRRE